MTWRRLSSFLAWVLPSSPTRRAAGGRRMEPPKKDKVRVGAIADLHYTRYPEPNLREMLAQAGRECDVLLLGGDLTDHGLHEEAQGLAREIHTAVGIPVVAVLGNHDFEAGKQDEVKSILGESGIQVLDG